MLPAVLTGAKVAVQNIRLGERFVVGDDDSSDQRPNSDESNAESDLGHFEAHG
jgi:hypothetical protein